MQMAGEQIIPASRDTVWAALNDPAILQQCIPGCETITRTSDTSMTAKVVAKVGPVKASFSGAVTLSDIDPPNGYRISGEGQGGVAGFAKGGATVTLTDVPGGTLLKYDVDAQIGGKLAQLGSRLIDATAKSYAKDFFDTFGRLVGEPAHDAATCTDPTHDHSHDHDHGHSHAAGHDHHDHGHGPADTGNGLPPGLWIAGVVGGATLVVWLAIVFG